MLLDQITTSIRVRRVQELSDHHHGIFQRTKGGVHGLEEDPDVDGQINYDPENRLAGSLGYSPPSRRYGLPLRA